MSLRNLLPNVRRRGIAALLAMVLGACRGTPTDQAPGASRPPRLPQVTGTLVVDGLSAPVSVVRDRWGIPHINATNVDDLFFAQGLVQAQDRLFQMDLWRRSVQGRLSEVLGANFIERDAMTRRVQYRGDLDREWASYGPETRRVATAFTRGINAWIALLGPELPEEFALAGWTPERWSPEDLLNRTDAFVASSGAQDDLFRARLAAAVGAAKADALLAGFDSRPTPRSTPVDFAAITHVLGELLRRAGTQPFFSGLAAPLGAGSNTWAVGGTRTASGMPMLAADPHRPFEIPSLRYLVHLTGPGWNVIGATAPWLPGVAIGHNERVAWSTAASGADVQDLFVERTNPANPRQVEYRGRWVDMDVEHDAIQVKGRSEPFEYDRLYTSHGVVIGLDADRHLAYTIRWAGTEPGGAAELGALALDRAMSWTEFRQGLTRWRMPPVEFVYADVDKHLGQRLAALLPARAGWNGSVPAAGWNGYSDWTGWIAQERLPHAEDPADSILVAANGNTARLRRLQERLSEPNPQTVDWTGRLQHDTLAWNATRLVPLLERVTIAESTIDSARRRLVAWDRRVEPDSPEASLYVAWEAAIARSLAERRVPPELADELVDRLPVVPLVEKPDRVWFDGDVVKARDELLVEALGAAYRRAPGWADGTPLPWGNQHETTFVHPFAVSAAARRRFNLGPFPAPGYRDTVFAVSADAKRGPAFRVIFDLGDWDRSVAMSAPGQSGWSASPHYADLAKSWPATEYFPLVFTPSAVQAQSETTLTLSPRGEP